jgi:hypothetical protein
VPNSGIAGSNLLKKLHAVLQKWFANLNSYFSASLPATVTFCHFDYGILT